MNVTDESCIHRTQRGRSGIVPSPQLITEEPWDSCSCMTSQARIHSAPFRTGRYTFSAFPCYDTLSFICERHLYFGLQWMLTEQWESFSVVRKQRVFAGCTEVQVWPCCVAVSKGNPDQDLLVGQCSGSAGRQQAGLGRRQAGPNWGCTKAGDRARSVHTDPHTDFLFLPPHPPPLMSSPCPLPSEHHTNESLLSSYFVCVLFNVEYFSPWVK